MKKILTFISICVFFLNAINAEITWNLAENGTLTISGTGNMDNYSYDIGAPWDSQRSEIRKVIIEDGVTSIGDNAFRECSHITSITIANSVRSIGRNAFFRCVGLTSIKIPNSVTSIEDCAFLSCSGLTSIILPYSVTNIGDIAFSYCSALSSIKVENGNVRYDSRNNCNAIIDKENNTLILGCKNTFIPDGVTSIGHDAFLKCQNLTSITMPNSITSIEYNAFKGCSNLSSINIPNSVTSIGNSAFGDCKNLKSVTIPNSVTNIGKGAFFDCSALTSVTIPNSVIEIQSTTFSGCTNLTSVTIPNSITRIGYGAFKKCSALCSITIPNSVLSLGGAVFDGCSSLTAITCEASTPPYCDYSDLHCFNGIYKYVPLYVPANSIDTYKTADSWKDFTIIQAIQDNQSIADAVIAKINAIGNVEYTDACKVKIDDASTAYDALTEAQKALVINFVVLTTARQTYDNLKATAEKLAADKALFDKYKSEVKAIIEAMVNEDDSDAVKDIIRQAISDIDALEYDAVISLDDNKAKVNSFVTSVNEAVENQRIEDQQATDIDKIKLAKRYNIYDLNGRKTTNSMFKSGIYIRNGKKVIVK